MLVIEDDSELRVLYRTALSLAGYTVIAVGDGLDALRRIDGGITPDILVLDLGLPLLGGRDVYRELRAHANTTNVPIVLATGSDTSDLDPSDFVCILKKPFDSDRLVAAVDDCLRKGREG